MSVSGTTPLLIGGIRQATTNWAATRKKIDQCSALATVP